MQSELPESVMEALLVYAESLDRGHSGVQEHADVLAAILADRLAYGQQCREEERARCAAVCRSRSHSLMHDGPRMRIEQAGEAEKCALAIEHNPNPLDITPEPTT